ncbi:23364_t:CDS:1, partial [Gigaspora margarita]
MSDYIPTVYIIRTEEHDCFILKLDETNYWLIDSGPARFPSYQYTKSAILKCKITNFKGIIITNPRKKHLDGMIRFFKECFPTEGVHAKEFPNLDFHVVLTNEFRNNPIIDILRDNGFEFDNKEPKFEYQKIFMECFFHENAMPLILKHNKDVKQDVNTVANRDNVLIARNNAKIQTDMSSILTYLQYETNGIKKSILLTSDNIASQIQSVLNTKINVYQQLRLNKRPFIDIFQ